MTCENFENVYHGISKEAPLVQKGAYRLRVPQKIASVLPTVMLTSHSSLSRKSLAMPPMICPLCAEQCKFTLPHRSGLAAMALLSVLRLFSASSSATRKCLPGVSMHATEEAMISPTEAVAVLNTLLLQRSIVLRCTHIYIHMYMHARARAYTHTHAPIHHHFLPFYTHQDEGETALECSNLGHGKNQSVCIWFQECSNFSDFYHTLCALLPFSLPPTLLSSSLPFSLPPTPLSSCLLPSSLPPVPPSIPSPFPVPSSTPSR